MLTVLSGTVEFSNDQGAVTVGHNEAALAEVARHRSRSCFPIPRDRVRWVNTQCRSRRHLSADAPAALQSIGQALQRGEMSLARRQLAALRMDAPQGACGGVLMLSDVQLVAGETDGAIITLENGAAPAASARSTLAQLARVYLLAERFWTKAPVVLAPEMP